MKERLEARTVVASTSRGCLAGRLAVAAPATAAASQAVCRLVVTPPPRQSLIRSGRIFGLRRAPSYARNVAWRYKVQPAQASGPSPGRLTARSGGSHGLYVCATDRGLHRGE